MTGNPDLLGQLHDKLDKDLSWRKKEITNLLLHISEQAGELQISLIRGAITLLYAHWEGFVKNSSINYLQYICGLDHKLEKLTENFCHISLGKAFPKLVSMNSYKQQKEVFDYINNEHQLHSLSINPTVTINTKSNLKFSVFEVICQQIGIDYSWYETKENFINKRLLGLRNPIAHGEFRSDNKILEDFTEVKGQILQCLDKFKELIVNSSEEKKFLRVREVPVDE